MSDLQRAIKQFSDWRWRLDNLYQIKDEKGKAVRFKLNWAQEQLWNEMHYLNIILKARQLGFTTFIQIFMLDKCLFEKNISAGTIAHRLEDAEDIFQNKVKFAYDHLDPAIKQAVSAEQDSARKLMFSNGSSIRVGTSLRSGTYQYLHVSEFGKLCAQFPERAREVVTGALNTIHAGQVGFIESTAEGREGPFYEMCEAARNLQRSGADLTEMDWKFHFFPWHKHPSYRLTGDVTMTTEDEEYFRDIGGLTPEQKAWYIKKKLTQGDDMKREFPSTPDEAFEASILGAYYANEMARMREEKRIGNVPWEKSLPVNTFWDLGRNDDTVIWFHQRHGKEDRFIDYYENSGESLAHYAKVLKDRPYTYGQHYLPHDVEVTDLSADQSRKNTLIDLGIKPIKTTKRPLNNGELGDQIETVRNFLGHTWIDESKCAKGIKCLDGYRKEWNDKLGVFRDSPLHDANSHGADGFRTGAVGFEPENEIPRDWNKRRNRKRFH